MATRTLPTQQATIPVVLMLTIHPDEREMEKEREAEMHSLLDTAGRSVVDTITQHVQKPAPGTYIGSGKVEELKEAVATTGAQQVVFDVRLSPRQQRNLEEEVGCAVLDYDELILDIFARNARTNQAMLAVELAQAEYDKARLKRMWTHLDRQTVGGSAGSGSGFKAGPGEKQIEMDRRQVRKRIQDLRGRLEEIAARKDRAVKTRSGAFNVALVGYTNAGKSTLMNALTNAEVLAQDRLFATLDTRTAQLFLDRHSNVVLSDTVGFIRKLPPTLIASFHATLAEVREADLLLHVVDSSSPVMEQQIEAVEEVLTTIAANEVPVVMVFNKVDKAYSKTILLAYRRRYKESVAVSALNGQGLDQLKDVIRSHIDRRARTVTVRFPVTDGALDAFVRSRAQVREERYEEDDAVLTIVADDRLMAELTANPNLAVEVVPAAK
jgi:GTP-binding protein HflX